MRKITAAMALGLSVVLLSGCGKSDSKSDDTKDAGQQSSGRTQPLKDKEKDGKGAAPEATGIDGTWKPINKSPIATMTISGNKVTTTGKLACPGTLKPGKKKSAIALDCTSKDPERSRGTLELAKDGTHIYIEWDGAAWGGMIDSLRRA
ncbi:hypothetical protein [Streptomyces sp. AN091965]|uniref:hypothetical protein n=1 Tax=Streptomyces sp. AN091965 TaxID=2927803 RepID=UPI001F61E8A7|nr:hypothetical protein [Streptomyces sp. AN091965]MCI3927918.1 hypothetical protein [Streptomyces sp. AN091965]